MSKMHDKWMDESRGMMAYTEWLEDEYKATVESLQAEVAELQKEKVRMAIHRKWLNINQPEK